MSLGAGPADRDAAMRVFVGRGADYYNRAFARSGGTSGWSPSLNPAAALLGPLWLGARRLWAAFWPFLIAELLGWIVFAHGFAGSAGQEATARATRLAALAAARLQEAQAAVGGDPVIAKSLAGSAAALAKAAEAAQREAAAAGGHAPVLIAAGLAIVVTTRLVLALLANGLLERRFRRWRLSHDGGTDLSAVGALTAAALILLILPVTLYAFTAPHIPDGLAQVPASADLHAAAAAAIDAALGAFSRFIAPVSTEITRGITAVLDLLEFCLVRTPWPVVMAIIAALAWQLAGRGVLVLTLGAMAYLAIFGYWAKSMETVALLGTAALLSILIGVPVGIWCGYSRRAAALVRPLLDFMQTMPAFVYLIPVIALFGIGKPSGIIATVIFGTPPMVRLTALGIRGVPASVREAALAFGATRRFLLFRIDLPLALPSIMIGVNQTILMCLSMVVIAALIGAKGLGEDVLSSLQYAAQGEGILAGLAILACAISLDRIVQGHHREDRR